jgi:SAM-dependent methyltransferase
MNTDHSISSNYDDQAVAYHQFLTTPLGILEQQLFTLCTTSCQGLRILDLGGGTGLRARDALGAGADAVDVVDISPEMMQQGQAHERLIGRDQVTWYQVDVSKSIDHLNLGPYDMVIANGIFDHARNAEEMEMVWRNAAKYLKPGGRLVANRNNPHLKAAREAKYGVTFTDFQNLPGGLSFSYRMATSPPLIFKSTALDCYYSGLLLLWIIGDTWKVLHGFPERAVGEDAGCESRPRVLERLP